MDIEDFNNKWKDCFKKNRLLWITTLNHRLVEFAEDFIILENYYHEKSVVSRNLIKTNKGMLATYYVGSSLILCIKTEKGIEHLHHVLKVPITEMNVIIKALFKCGFREIS